MWLLRPKPTLEACVMPVDGIACGLTINGGAILISEDGETRTPLCHQHTEAMFRGLVLALDKFVQEGE